MTADQNSDQPPGTALTIPATVRFAGERVTVPTIVHSRADIASLLRAHRTALGWTCEETDARAGFSDRYVTKMEHGDTPTGRKGFHINSPTQAQPAGEIRSSFMADVWLETMGLQLVLLPVETARAIGAVPAPKRAESA